MDPTEVDATILYLAASRGMVVTSRHLQAAGVSPSQIQRRSGRMLTPLSAGVYAVGAVTPEVRLRGALAALPHAFVSDGAAGRRHGLPVRDPDEVSVLLHNDHRTRRHIEGVRIRYTRWLPLADLTSVDGLPMTTVARTLCDLSARYPAARLRHLIEHAFVERLTSSTEFQACLLGWCRRGRVGSGVLRRVGELVADQEPVPGSELERRANDLFRRAGLPLWAAQYQPPWYDGVRGTVDMAWPEARLVVELDGRRWHATTQAQADDRRRDRLAAEHGWLTLRFGWQEIVERPDVVIDECRRILAARMPSTVPPQTRRSSNCGAT